VATNTTLDRKDIRDKYVHIQKGGISGPLLWPKTLETVHHIYNFNHRYIKQDKRLVVVACGGISDISQWREMQEYGADLCQVLTGFVFGGPYFFKKMCRDSLSKRPR